MCGSKSTCWSRSGSRFLSVVIIIQLLVLGLVLVFGLEIGLDDNFNLAWILILDKDKD